jgi:VanZ family protein
MNLGPVPLQYRSLWLGLAWALVGVVIWLSLGPVPPSIGIDPANVLGPGLAYLSLSLCFGALYEGGRRVAVGLALIALGGALELLQGLVASRVFDPWDALANTVGVAAGALVSHRVAARLPAALERALAGGLRPGGSSGRQGAVRCAPPETPEDCRR